jgi:hypothetical protein
MDSRSRALRASPRTGSVFSAENGLVVTDLSIYPACDLDTAVRHLDKIEGRAHQADRRVP